MPLYELLKRGHVAAAHLLHQPHVRLIRLGSTRVRWIWAGHQRIDGRAG
jgi:hypothetical protein